MLGLGQDVEFFPPVRTVAVADQAKVLEDIECPVDSRWDRRRIDLPAAPHELTSGDVPVGPGEDLDEHPALGCPAQAASVQPIPDRRRVAEEGLAHVNCR
jgi:hypothetical protein